MKYKIGSRSYTAKVYICFTWPGKTKAMYSQECGALLNRNQEQLLSDQKLEAGTRHVAAAIIQLETKSRKNANGNS